MAHERDTVTRRRFLAVGATALSVGCAGTTALGHDAAQGHLRARPNATPPSGRVPPGEHPLALGTERDGLLYVPRELPPKAPLVVLLHGATGSSKGVASRMMAVADEFQTILLAPDSKGTTWDAIGGRFGRDVAFIDSALEHAFRRVPLDDTRIAIGGFSDGASYALSLGLINGDLFTHVLAFSPGFLVAEQRRGKPAIFVSHGTHDEILPIDATSRRLVPRLRNAGYRVDYREFDGPHTVPSPVAREAFEWMNGGARSGAAVAH
jgi:phospholipase/carboxylesterase